MTSKTKTTIWTIVTSPLSAWKKLNEEDKWVHGTFILFAVTFVLAFYSAAAWLPNGGFVRNVLEFILSFIAIGACILFPIAAHLQLKEIFTLRPGYGKLNAAWAFVGRLLLILVYICVAIGVVIGFILQWIIGPICVAVFGIVFLSQVTSCFKK